MTSAMPEADAVVHRGRGHCQQISRHKCTLALAQVCERESHTDPHARSTVSMLRVRVAHDVAVRDVTTRETKRNVCVVCMCAGVGPFLSFVYSSVYVYVVRYTQRERAVG